jgi:hypothetical protein
MNLEGIGNKITHRLNPFLVSAQLKISPEDFFEAAGGPSFIGDIHNVTVKAGRDAVLNCVVKNLGEYKVKNLG